jgi:hypothetical protein
MKNFLFLIFGAVLLYIPFTQPSTEIPYVYNSYKPIPESDIEMIIADTEHISETIVVESESEIFDIYNCDISPTDSQIHQVPILLSTYWPPDGGINTNGNPLDTSTGIWDETWFNTTAACPLDWTMIGGYTTLVTIPELNGELGNGSYACRDRGGAIKLSCREAYDSRTHSYKYMWVLVIDVMYNHHQNDIVHPDGTIEHVTEWWEWNTFYNWSISGINY